MRLAKILLYILIPGMLLFLFLALRPISVHSLADCGEAEGELLRLEETGVRDLSLWIAGDERHFYINRGLEKGLDLDALQAGLLGRPVTLHYARHWTPLNPFSNHRHVVQLEAGGELVFRAF